MEKVSIALLFFHREKMAENYDSDMMRECVYSIIRNTEDFELIAVDNGSTTDESWINQYASKYIRFDKNEGISNGWNAGIEAASNDKVIILGDDTVVNAGWAEAMLDCFDQPDCGAACPHVEGMPNGRGIRETLSWFPGACFMLSKKRTVEKVGYFDWETYYPCNFEDVDYFVRVLAHGLKLYTNHNAEVLHRQGATLHVDDLQGEFGRLKQAFIDKHGFDGQDAFYISQNIEDYLHLVNKKKVLPKVFL